MNHRSILVGAPWLLAFAAIAQAVTIWIFWRSINTPIERHYLSAYFWSSLPVVGPSTVEVRLIWKTGRHQKQQLAKDDDAVSADDGTSMALSQSAREAGWKALIEGPPLQLPADLLRQDLAGLAFEGQAFWDLLLLPELSGFGALCAALCTWCLLLGFFRAVPSEIAWRQRFSALEELSSSLFKECAALARSVRSGLKPLRRNAVRRLATHSAAPNAEITVIAPEPTPASFALPLFGVYNEIGKGYLWSERDAIE